MNPRAAYPLALCLGLAAQDAPRVTQPAPPPAVGFAAAHGVFECDGQLVALGPDYKAWFHHGEVEFVPAFGRSAPRNHPLRLRATGMARGDTAVAFAAVAAERRGDDAVQFRRTNDVTEVYSLHERGLEQTFVLAKRPAGDGDLHVTLAVRCDVAGEPDGQGGLRFQVPDVGVFTLGTLTGVDAHGNRASGSLLCTRDTLTLTLPADFVDHAAYPLVLDPLLGGPTLQSGLDREYPDVVYDHGTGDWCAVWVTYVSATDADVYGQRIAQATGSPVGGVFPIDVSTANTDYPRLGSVRLVGRVLVVYHVDGAVFPPTSDRIVGRSINVATGVASADATIASVNSIYDVAGDETTVDDEALVVWGASNNMDVLAAQVTLNATGAPVPSSPVVVDTGSTTGALCSISKTSGGTGKYLIAWRPAGSPLVNPPTTLHGVLVSRNLAILTPSHVLDTNAWGVPSVDCSGSSYLVAYTHLEPASTTNRDVMAVSVAHQAAAGILVVTAGPTAIEATPGQDDNHPQVAWLGQRYGVTFSEGPGTNSENVGAWLVDPDCTTCNTRMSLTGVNLSANYTQERQPRIAGRAAWQPGANDGMVVYTEDQPSPSHPIVVGQRVLSVGPGGAVTSLGGGCGQGGLATATTNGFALGNNACRFECSGLPAGALPLCCLGVPSPTIPCGTCTFLNPLASFFEPSLAGTASHTFRVPCSTIYIGFQMEVQWVSLLTPSSPCPLVPGMSASARVRFTVGP